MSLDNITKSAVKTTNASAPVATVQPVGMKVKSGVRAGLGPKYVY